jgi:hypothetical protein
VPYSVLAGSYLSPNNFWEPRQRLFLGAQLATETEQGPVLGVQAGMFMGAQLVTLNGPWTRVGSPSRDIHGRPAGYGNGPGTLLLRETRSGNIRVFVMGVPAGLYIGAQLATETVRVMGVPAVSLLDAQLAIETERVLGVPAVSSLGVQLATETDQGAVMGVPAGPLRLAFMGVSEVKRVCNDRGRWPKPIAILDTCNLTTPSIAKEWQVPASAGYCGHDPPHLMFLVAPGWCLF